MFVTWKVEDIITAISNRIKNFWSDFVLFWRDFSLIDLFAYTIAAFVMWPFLLLCSIIPMYVWLFYNLFAEEIMHINRANKLHDIAQLHHCKVYQEP